MKIDLDKNHITAEEGKIFRRKFDGYLAGKDIYLGLTFYLNGKELSTPLKEIPDHYEEIDEPVTKDDVIMDEENPLVELFSDEPVSYGETVELKKVTVGDFMDLKGSVEEILAILKK